MTDVLNQLKGKTSRKVNTLWALNSQWDNIMDSECSTVQF